jgi:hypothetical protein
LREGQLIENAEVAHPEAFEDVISACGMLERASQKRRMWNVPRYDFSVV